MGNTFVTSDGRFKWDYRKARPSEDAKYYEQNTFS
jgi:hypothetical protein